MFSLENCKKEMENTVSALVIEHKNIRTGRVSPDILKTIIIDSYGSKTPLTQLSNINNIDNMTLNINVWDASLVKSIEKNIIESNLGVNPQTDGTNILIKFPELTSERRKEIVKIISEISEKYKISIRNVRRKYIDEIKLLEKDKSISIDDSKKNQEEVQKLTDISIKNIESLTRVKENEVLKV
jgi:ribosome recycling factor